MSFPVVLMSFDDFGLHLGRKYVLSFVCGEDCEPFRSSEGGSLGFDGSREINDRISLRGSGGCVVFQFMSGRMVIEFDVLFIEFDDVFVFEES